MILAFLGLALLAASWLPGLGYYHEADWLLWAILTVGGATLLLGAVRRIPGGAVAIVAAALSLPALWLAPWPYRAAPLLLVAGLALAAAPIPRRWPKHVARAAVAAAVVLLAQSVTMFVYESLTARSHDLPRPLVHLLRLVARLLGIEAAVDGSYLVLASMRKTHRLAATWGLLLDPPTLGFLVGGTALLVLVVRSRRPSGQRLVPWLRRAGTLLLVTLCWAPLRAGLLLSLYLHRVLRTGYDAPLDAVSEFWSTPLHILLLAPPALAAWRLIRPPAADDALTDGVPSAPPWRHLLSPVPVFAAAALLTAAVLLDPVGERKGGKVLIHDHVHPDSDPPVWEPAARPFDTEWYGHESGYNYAAIVDYCSRFYNVSLHTDHQITDEALAKADVLVLKVPVVPYSRTDVDAVRRFVGRGGGLLLIGEHTSVFHSGLHLNDLARHFGFRFRYDCLFSIPGEFHEQLYTPPLVPHPVIQNMGPLDFAVSCSIAPGLSRGRAVIRGRRLKSSLADYHVSNFYPAPDDRPEMRYGAFVQLWATRRGAGRVVAFTDSTIFSNFSAFEPGKPELLLGTIEWLNRRNRGADPRPWLAVLALLLLAGGLVLAWRWDRACVVLLGAALLGWSAAAVYVKATNRMPLPEPRRPMVRVAMDRTVCAAPLPKGGFIAGQPDQFGIFERWVLRLGYFLSRPRGKDTLEAVLRQSTPLHALSSPRPRDPFDGDLVVFLHPNQHLAPGFSERLVRYVDSGGKVLVLDSPENKDSKANGLLHPFKLTVSPVDGRTGQPIPPGVLTVPEPWPSVVADSACQITGGQPLALVGDVPVAAAVRHGKGLVVVVGFASRFSDANMGVTGDVVPDAELRQVFDLQFAFLRAVVAGKLPALAPPPPAPVESTPTQ